MTDARIKQKKLSKENNKGKTPIEKLDYWITINSDYIAQVCNDLRIDKVTWDGHLGAPGIPGTIRNWLYVNETNQKAHKQDWGRFIKAWITSPRRYNNDNRSHGNPSQFSKTPGFRKVPKISGHGK